MFSFLKSFYCSELLIVLSLCLISNGSIHDKVSYYEFITVYESHIRDKRSVDKVIGQEKITKEFIFQAFNRSFNCQLNPRTDFFSSNFKLKVFGADGVSQDHSFRKDQIFVGKCNGDAKSEIRGVFTNGIFSGSVLYEGQLYGIEDSKHHIPSKNDCDDSGGKMIVYRTSDIRWQTGRNKNGHGPTFCGAIHAKPENIIIENRTMDIIIRGKFSRHKRATTPSWNTCKVITVADYKFFREVGNSNVYDTALYMAGVIDRVDSIYRNTVFNINGSPYTGLGFEIAEMNIYQSPTTGFNHESESWTALALLQSFSRNMNYRNFCIAHLFTHQSFEGNVLGLAYIAPPRDGDVGGICSKMAIIGNSLSTLNTGWSSSKNHYGDAILLQQSDLVTAHEFGHNWGAEHDPDDGGVCSPSTSFGNGKYLMYRYSVSGYDSNNFVFSPCSRDFIGTVLSLKGSSCLKEKSFSKNQICGNGLIDAGEECDAGLIGRFNLDKCCDNSCKLVGGATCSPVNHGCCTNCQVATVGTVCRSDNGFDCYKSAVCDGVSLQCPDPQLKDDGEECLDQGHCKAGECLAFCESRGLVSCACEKMEYACQRCCRASVTAECRPYDNKHPLPDGRPCISGYCEGVVCKSSKVTTLELLFGILENLDADNAESFFRRNLVGCVIVLSLLLWLPICVVIWCKDKREQKQRDCNEDFETLPLTPV